MGVGTDRSGRRAAAASACALTLVAAGCGTMGGETSGPVTVGFLYDVHAANVWTLDSCANDEVEFELLNFKQFADVQRSFETGEVDVAAMGYQNLAQMVEAGFTDFKAVAGVYTGAEHISFAPDSGIEEWEDLVGRSVGIPPNSFVEMLFLAEAEENGLDANEVDIVPFPGAGPPMISALEQGEVDAIVTWEPTAAEAHVGGSGDYGPFNIQEGAAGDATSLLYASDELLENRPDESAAVVECLAERTDALNSDVDEWVRELQEQTGMNEEVAGVAVETGEMDVQMYEESAIRIIEAFSDNGLIQEMSDDDILSYLDYSLLEGVTDEDT